MRHKDVRLCPMGAYGLYLLMRFKETKEFDNQTIFDENKNWFDLKMLVGTEPCCDWYKPMSSDTFSSAMRKLLNELDISSQKLLHIGRVLGTANLEMAENAPEGTRQMGNWGARTEEVHYSIKLPISTMRTAAGHVAANGMFFVPRSQVMPDEELRKSVFPFVYTALPRILQKRQSSTRQTTTTNYATAMSFLHMLDHLAMVVLQDAAATMVLHPERQYYDGFLQFPHIFQSDKFLVSV